MSALSLYFVSILSLAVIAVILGIIAYNNYSDTLEFLAMLFGVVISVVILISVIILISARIDKNFINKNFNTNYTTEDMFFNGSDIKQMVIGKKINIE